MAIKTGIIFCTLLLGSLAVPVPEDDMSIYFPENHSARIVGGNVAARGAHPWMVAMSNGAVVRRFVCGGSIITQRTVLTAAHCIVAVVSGNSLSSSLRVTVGTNSWSSGGVSHNLNGFVVHAQYNGNTIKNDIGTLFTSQNIAYTDTVRAIALSFEHAPGGVQSRVAGWGATRGGGPAQAQLLEIQVNTIDGNQCVEDIRQASINLNTRAPPVDPSIEICTFHGVGRGTCQGDSGSALVRTDNSQQIGIVSWGFPCARGAPDMFVRVSAFQSWITQNSRN